MYYFLLSVCIILKFDDIHVTVTLKHKRICQVALTCLDEIEQFITIQFNSLFFRLGKSSEVNLMLNKMRFKKRFTREKYFILNIRYLIYLNI